MSGVPTWYDVLDVDATAGEEEIRAAWRRSVADLDPTDRRFRTRSQAAEVLLDPARRAAYDAELAGLARRETDPEPATTVRSVEDGPARSAGRRLRGLSLPRPARRDREATAAPRIGRAVPAWLLVLVGALALAAVTAAAYAWTRPYEPTVTAVTAAGRGEVEEAAQEAQTRAEAAIVPVLSYDYRTLADDQSAVHAYLTADYRKDYDELFAVIEQNAPTTGTVVTTEVIASAITRAGPDRVQVLVFVNRSTTRNDLTEPRLTGDQVTVTMQRLDGEWLVDDLVTTPLQS